jgi:hypothetical protein
MNKRAPADIDPRSIAVDFFRKLGGMEGMTKWGRTHRSHAYSLIAKLLAQPLVQNVAVNVIDGEAARRKLEDAFLQLIESRKYEGVDPAAFINGERLEPLTIDHRPGERFSHTPTIDRCNATCNSRPATRDCRPAIAAARPNTSGCIR